MIHPGARIQVDVKAVPYGCFTVQELRLFQFIAIDEFPVRYV